MRPGHRRRLLATGRYPTLQYIADKNFEYDLDVVFHTGLRRLLDGIASLVTAPKTARDSVTTHW